MDENNESLAFEMLKNLKQSYALLFRLFIGALVVIALLVAGLVGTSTITTTNGVNSTP